MSLLNGSWEGLDSSDLVFTIISGLGIDGYNNFSWWMMYFWLDDWSFELPLPIFANFSASRLFSKFRRNFGRTLIFGYDRSSIWWLRWIVFGEISPCDWFKALRNLSAPTKSYMTFHMIASSKNFRLLAGMVFLQSCCQSLNAWSSNSRFLSWEFEYGSQSLDSVFCKQDLCFFSHPMHMPESSISAENTSYSVIRLLLSLYCRTTLIARKSLCWFLLREKVDPRCPFFEKSQFPHIWDQHTFLRKCALPWRFQRDF